jgi:crossover junction endodeoxyribonuclease RusA
MADYDFAMPWPPSVNAWKTPFRNRMILSKRGREYRKLALVELEQMGLMSEGIEENVSVSIVLNPPTLRRYDIDNFCKSLFDALTEGQFWLDDSQITTLNIKKGIKTKGGNIEVKVNVVK